MKKNTKQINKGLGNGRIDVDRIYKQMQEAICHRNALQRQMDNLWDVIKKHHCNREAEMDKVTNGIGNATHRINGLINELCRYNKTHRAMNLAYEFISNEIARSTKIISSKERSIWRTEAGLQCLIRDTGVETTDTSNLRKYVAKKKAQVQKLQTWKEHAQRYMI